MSSDKLDEQYKELLRTVKSSINQLTNKEDAVLCLKWLAKIDELEDDGRHLRNNLLSKLNASLTSGCLQFPFTRQPSSGLQDLVDDNMSNWQEPSYREMRHHPETISNAELSYEDIEMLPYEDRTIRYKATIAKYQKVLRDLLRSSDFDNSGTTQVKKPCMCPKVKVNTPANVEAVHVNLQKDIGNNLTDKVENLMENHKRMANRFERFEQTLMEIRSLSNKQQSRNSEDVDQSRSVERLERTVNKLKRSQEDILTQFRKQLEEAMRNKDAVIFNIEKSMRLSEENCTGTVDQSTLDKLEALETKYKQLLEKQQRDHQAERMADRKKIRELESMIVAANLSGR